MKVETLKPLPTNLVPFDLTSYKQVPRSSGCYILSTYDNEILYIGLTKNLYNRFIKHLNTPEKINPTIDGRAIWFHYMVFDTQNLPKLERTWLNQFLIAHARFPILNKISSPLC